MPDPEGQGDVEEQEERPKSEVDARSGEARVEDRERDARRREASAGGDVPRASERQVAEDRVRRDLGAEDLEHGRERQEVFPEADQRAHDSALRELLEEQRQERCGGLRSAGGAGGGA